MSSLDEIRVLQLGNVDWRTLYTLPEHVELHYVESIEEVPRKPYDLVFLDRTPRAKEIGLLHQTTKAYTLFVTPQVTVSGMMEWLYCSKRGRKIEQTAIQDFFDREARNYFPKPYGEKFRPGNLAIAHDFAGTIRWNGSYSVCLQGDYGTRMRQIAYWRNNIPVFAGQCIDLWLEYRKDPGVSIALSVIQFVKGSISEIQQKWEFSEEELEQIVSIDNQLAEGPIFVSLQAKGSGELQIIALHDRYSRRGHGYFLPGGDRYVTSEREEIFCYFDPGDMKPPLNVYFSGYKTMEGFEGYHLIRNLGCPFLLVAEARLEGGSFYMGSEEYERVLCNAVRRYMVELGFGADEVIFSGLSMGTFGALYYGCDIGPHAVILGKPLASIGNVAAGEKRMRPGGFPTSLDVLMRLCGYTDEVAVERLNARFWNKFDAADWSRTKFIVSYMIEDDYDADAYASLIEHLRSDGAELYGKGIHGRHNDNTGGIVNWFVDQFDKILREDFGRKRKR